MKKDQYQILPKAQYINLLLLKDELKYFDDILSKEIKDIDSWLAKLRATRGVFLTLNNVRDSAISINIKGSSDFILKSRKIKKDLLFANHFRNRGIGHLNITLLERAVQWHPQIFHENARNSKEMQTAEAHRAIIESCINSYIDQEEKQKIFGTEIDLMYPPDADMFFTYLFEIVRDAIGWISDAESILSNGIINHHSEEDIKELALIAGQTNFNLKSESPLDISDEKVKIAFSTCLEDLEKLGTDENILEFLRKYLQR